MTRINKLNSPISINIAIFLLIFFPAIPLLHAQAIIEIPLFEPEKEEGDVYVIVLMEEPTILKSHLGEYRVLGFFKVKSQKGAAIKVFFEVSMREDNKHYLSVDFISNSNKRNYQFNFYNYGDNSELPLTLKLNSSEIIAIFTQGTKENIPGMSNPRSRHLIIAAGGSIEGLSEKYSVSNLSFDWSSPREFRW